MGAGCARRVYEIPDDAPAKGTVDVIVNYTNCVQCGAITAKGGLGRRRPRAATARSYPADLQAGPRAARDRTVGIAAPGAPFRRGPSPSMDEAC